MTMRLAMLCVLLPMAATSAGATDEPQWLQDARARESTLPEPAVIESKDRRTKAYVVPARVRGAIVRGRRFLRHRAPGRQGRGAVALRDLPGRHRHGQRAQAHGHGDLRPHRQRAGEDREARDRAPTRRLEQVGGIPPGGLDLRGAGGRPQATRRAQAGAVGARWRWRSMRAQRNRLPADVRARGPRAGEVARVVRCDRGRALPGGARRHDQRARARRRAPERRARRRWRRSRHHHAVDAGADGRRRSRGATRCRSSS
ncbi:MAG: hypothetical protein MZV49_12785 [Rhodopseudomonas palustris]|nr:hypothetical protein [Rhodopseudomonas palustris]